MWLINMKKYTGRTQPWPGNFPRSRWPHKRHGFAAAYLKRYPAQGRCRSRLVLKRDVVKPECLQDLHCYRLGYSARKAEDRKRAGMNPVLMGMITRRDSNPRDPYA